MVTATGNVPTQKELPLACLYLPHKNGFSVKYPCSFRESAYVADGGFKERLPRIIGITRNTTDKRWKCNSLCHNPRNQSTHLFSIHGEGRWVILDNKVEKFESHQTNINSWFSHSFKYVWHQKWHHRALVILNRFTHRIGCLIQRLTRKDMIIYVLQLIICREQTMRNKCKRNQ